MTIRQDELTFTPIRTFTGATAADSQTLAQTQTAALATAKVPGLRDSHVVPGVVEFSFSGYVLNSGSLTSLTFDIYKVVAGVVYKHDSVTVTAADLAANAVVNFAVMSKQVYPKLATVTGASANFGLVVNARAIT